MYTSLTSTEVQTVFNAAVSGAGAASGPFPSPSLSRRLRSMKWMAALDKGPSTLRG
jgi:hypothetical protein